MIQTLYIIDCGESMHEISPHLYTVEPRYMDTTEMRTSPLIRTLCTVPVTYKTTPEMRTPPLIRTL